MKAAANDILAMPKRRERHAANGVAVKEANFQATVIELAELHGWRVYHTHDSRRSQPGFPDLTLVRRYRLIFAELKREGGKLTAEQTAWLS